MSERQPAGPPGKERQPADLPGSERQPADLPGSERQSADLRRIEQPPVVSWRWWIAGMDWGAFEPRLGIDVALVVVLAGAFSHIAGLNGVLVVLSAAFLKVADRRAAPLPARVADLLGFAVVLMVVVAIAWSTAGGLWTAVLALASVTLLGALAAALGPHCATQGFLASTYLLLMGPLVASTSLTSVVLDVPLGAGLVVVLAMAETALRRVGYRTGRASASSGRHRPPAGKAQAYGPDTGPPDTGPLDTGPSDTGPETDPDTGAHAAAAPTAPAAVIIPAIGKAVAVGLATLVGWFATGGHPFWAAFAPLMIIRPVSTETRRRGVRRIGGTVVGAILGWLLVRLVGDPTALSVLLVPLAFVWFSCLKVDYAVFVCFMTAFIVILAALGGGPVDTLAAERIIATAVGVAIAFAVVFVQFRLFLPPDGSRRREEARRSARRSAN